jgi:hypothetical protein
MNPQTQWDSRYQGLETEGSVHSNAPYDHEPSSFEWLQGNFSYDYQPFAVEWKADAIEYAIHFAGEKRKIIDQQQITNNPHGFKINLSLCNDTYY